MEMVFWWKKRFMYQKVERGCVKFAVPNAFGNFDTASLYHMRQSPVLFQKFHANTWTVGRHGHLTVHNLDAVESVVGDEPVAIEVSPVAEWRKLSRSGHSA